MKPNEFFDDDESVRGPEIDSRQFGRSVYSGLCYSAFPIYLSEKCVNWLRRPWKMRIAGRPWNPLRAYDSVPSDTFFLDEGVFFMHPETFEKVRAWLDNPKDYEAPRVRRG